MQLAFALACVGVLLVAGGHASGPSWATPALAWVDALSTSDLLNPGRQSLYQAIGLYLAAGLLWAVVYTHSIHTRLSGPYWERGLVFACAPWTFSLVVLLPMAGCGVFGLALGAGPLPMVGSLALHGVYGVTLAWLLGPIGDVVLEPSPLGAVQGAALQRAEVGAAVGVVAGLALGAAIGLVLLGGSHLAVEAARSSTDPLAVLAATTVAGVAGGALVGSFAGLARSEPYVSVVR
jgi:hypothetical protein